MKCVNLRFFCLLRPNIVAHKEEGDKRGEAAGDLFGVELFQQSAVGDVGGDDGGQLRAQTVVQQAVKGADEEAGVELGTQVVEDEQVGPGGGAQDIGLLEAVLTSGSYPLYPLMQNKFCAEA